MIDLVICTVSNKMNIAIIGDKNTTVTEVNAFRLLIKNIVNTKPMTKMEIQNK
jgi:hypothetical protein